MRKKILIISYFAYPLFHPEADIVHGGAEVALYNVANYIDKDKFEVAFLVGDFGQTKTVEKNDKITIYTGPVVGRSNLVRGLRNFWKLFRLIRRINPDIILSSSAGWLTVELLLIKKILGKKYVFRSSHQRNINGFIDSKSYGKLYRRLIPSIDCFVLQNKEDVALLKQNYAFEAPVKCIRSFQIIPKEAPLGFSKRKYVLWIGRSEKIKKPELFLEMAKALPELEFIMIMPKTNEQVFIEISQTAEKIENLKIIDGVKRGEILKFYRQAIYLVSTSEGEGFPNVVLEAMKCGTPIVSLFLDYDGLIREHNCGIVCDGKVEVAVDFVKEIKAENWTGISKNCYNYAREHFNIERGIKEYEEIFEAL